MRAFVLFCVLACAPRPEEPCVIVRVPGATVVGEPVVIHHTGKCPGLFAANALRTDEQFSAQVADAGVLQLSSLPAGLYGLEDARSRFRSFVIYSELSTAERRLPARCFTLGFVDGGFGCDDRLVSSQGVGPPQFPDAAVDLRSGETLYGHFDRCGVPFLRGYLNRFSDAGIIRAAACSYDANFAWASPTDLTRVLPDGGLLVDQFPGPTNYVAMRFVGNHGLVVLGGLPNLTFGHFWCRTESVFSNLLCERYFSQFYPQNMVGSHVLSSTGTAFGPNRNSLGSWWSNVRELGPMEDSPGNCASIGLEASNGIGFRLERADSELCIMVDENGAYGVTYPQEQGVDATIRAAGFVGPYLWASDWTTTSLFRIPGR
jgi:hypothetical protein